MPTTPKSVRMSTPSDCLYTTADGLTEKSVLGLDRRATFIEQIPIPAVGQFVSLVVPPADVAVAIIGVSVAYGNMVAPASVFLSATTRGSELLGTASLGYGAYGQVTATQRIPAGAAEGTVVDLLPDDANVLLVNGDGANSLWAAQATALTPPDAVDMFVHYIPLFANTLAC